MKQEEWVIKKLKEDGAISRNHALQNFITRLSAIILNLNNEGWKIEGHYEKTIRGRDYVYTLIESKKREVWRPQSIDGGVVTLVKVKEEI